MNSLAGRLTSVWLEAAQEERSSESLDPTLYSDEAIGSVILFKFNGVVQLKPS